MSTKLSITTELRHPALLRRVELHRMFVSRWRPTGFDERVLEAFIRELFREGLVCVR